MSAWSSTVREGFMNDYYVVLVRDGTAAYSNEEHEMTVRNIDRFFGEVSTIEELHGIWSGRTLEVRLVPTKTLLLKIDFVSDTTVDRLTGSMAYTDNPSTIEQIGSIACVGYFVPDFPHLMAAYIVGAQAQAPLQKIRVTIPVPVLPFYPLYVARDHGDFAKQGLDVEIITTSGDGPDVDALIAGSVQFTVSTPNRLFMAYEQGKPLLAVANLGNLMAIECWMNKDTADKLGISVATPLEQRLKALKGLTVAGTRPGAFTYLLLVEYAKRVGLEPQKDLKIIGSVGLQR